MSRNSHRKHEYKSKHSLHKNTTNQEIPEDDIFVEHRGWSEVLIALIIFALGLFFMVPVFSATTVNIQFALLILFVIAVLLFVVTHWRKQKQYSAQHKLPLLENFVYLSIISILMIAIVIQVVSGTLDLWLPVILVVAVLLKVLLTTRVDRK